MYPEVAWVLVSSGTQVQPQVTIDPDYLPDYLSVSYDYDVRDNVLSSLHIEGLTKSLKILKVFFYWIRIVWKTNGYLVISTIHINENKATTL